MSPVISVSRLSKKFKEFIAVDSISFAVEKGEILGLLGPNGAGKTTTIQMLLGVLTPTSGSITVLGKNLYTHRQEVLEKMNFSSTYTNLPWALTVEENLTYLSLLYEIADRKKRIQEIVEAFRLEKLLKQEMTELSAGQLTRVNLAKAFLNDPEILLLDEPTASLDPEIASFVRNYIVEQRDKRGLSILFTSHNMPEVEEICDRVLFINTGKIVADDTPLNLARQLDFCRLQLTAEKGELKKIGVLATEKNLSSHIDDGGMHIELKEKELPDFLQKIATNKVRYFGISIDKPTLEDYFLHMAGGENGKGMERVM